MPVDIYATLGVPKDATKEQIKKAYRKRSLETHPDKHGGDKGKAEEFMALTRYYKILSDDEARKRYDAGEDPESIAKDGESIEEQAIKAVVQLFMAVIDGEDEKTTNVFKAMHQSIDAKTTQYMEERNRSEQRIKKAEEALARIICKPKAPNIFEASLNQQILMFKQNVANCERNIEIGKAAKKIIDNYAYRVDPKTEDPFGIPYDAFRARWVKG